MALRLLVQRAAMMQQNTPLEVGPGRLRAVRDRAHPHCVVCGSQNPLGLGMEFIADDDGGVRGWFGGSRVFAGYTGLLHGGVVAALLDGAMTNCLFAQGREALTADLQIRFHLPVLVEERMEVRAWVQKTCKRLHHLRAELKQNGCVKATATAKFLERHE